MIKKLMAVAGVIGAVAVLILLIGLVAPRSSVARCRVTLHEPIDRVWASLSSVEKWAAWHPDIAAVEMRAKRNGNSVFMTRGDGGEIEIEVATYATPVLFEIRLDGWRFDGVQRYELTDVLGTTQITVTQESDIVNPFLRGLDFFCDEHASMIQTLVGLGERHGMRRYPKEIDGGG